MQWCDEYYHISYISDICIWCIVAFCVCRYMMCMWVCIECFFFFQAEDGIRDLVRSRGLGDVYKRQTLLRLFEFLVFWGRRNIWVVVIIHPQRQELIVNPCLLYTSDAADERSSVDLGGRRIIKKKKTYKKNKTHNHHNTNQQEPIWETSWLKTNKEKKHTNTTQ